MLDIAKIIGMMVKLVQNGNVRKCTKYISATETIKATARHKPDKRSKRCEVIVTIGRPNYREKKFIKLCQKAGEPYPIEKIQLVYWKK